MNSFSQALATKAKSYPEYLEADRELRVLKAGAR